MRIGFGLALMLVGSLAGGCKRAATSTSQPLPAREGGVGFLGLGREPTAAEIAAWRDEVLPDGTGLPDGHGTAAEGAGIVATKCAGCHGLHGEGATALPLVGGGAAVPGYRIGRAARDEPRPTWVEFYPYATTLFDYTRRAMPYNAPGSLSDDETYAVVAWMLQQAGLWRADQALDRSTLARIEMPARSRFVFEDVSGGR